MGLKECKFTDVQYYVLFKLQCKSILSNSHCCNCTFNIQYNALIVKNTYEWVGDSGTKHIYTYKKHALGVSVSIFIAPSGMKNA